MTICDNCTHKSSCEEYYLTIDGLELCEWYDPIEDPTWYSSKKKHIYLEKKEGLDS